MFPIRGSVISMIIILVRLFVPQASFQDQRSASCGMMMAFIGHRGDDDRRLPTQRLTWPTGGIGRNRYLSALESGTWNFSTLFLSKLLYNNKNVSSTWWGAASGNTQWLQAIRLSRLLSWSLALKSGHHYWVILDDVEKFVMVVSQVTCYEKNGQSPFFGNSFT